LQIAVVAETMRREGYEMLISRPEVITHEVEGKIQEPIEELWLEVPQEHLGDTMQCLSARKGDMTHLEHRGNTALVEARLPTRGLIGLEGYLTNLTGGRALVSHLFHEYRNWCGEIPSRTNGALIAMESGTATGYALDGLQQRGTLFVGPQTQVYPGMIVGEHSRGSDLPCNPTRTKQLTNVRASGADKAIQLEPPTLMNLEQSLEWIAGDEYVEATPRYLRMRKKILNASRRKRAGQAEKQRNAALG
jgi:GTP-binding protein